MKRHPYRLVLASLFVLLLVASWAKFSTSQSLRPPERRGMRTADATSANLAAIAGKWTYRSFLSEPDLAIEPNELLFGAGTMEWLALNDTQISGTLGGNGWQLTLAGEATGSAPTTLRFRGQGTIGGENWVYDYIGYVVPKWPNGVDQRPAIVGTIVRTAPHTGGDAEAGVVAQWIAVKQDDGSARGASLHRLDEPANPADSPYREKIREMYLDEAAKERATVPTNRDRPPAGRGAVPASDATQETIQEGSAPGRLRQSSLQPATIRSRNGRLDVELVVDYATVPIGADTVKLRTYNSKLVGPVLRAKAGDTLFITLRNKLPVEPGGSHPMNSFHDWNTTNLHFHGLHVAPQGTPAAESDNVLLELKPNGLPDGSVQKYEVKIPPDHVAGTFWYHAHKHGAVAAQVSSGMAGPLIIERDDSVHNLDSVPEVAAAVEELLLLQQIPYLKATATSTGLIERSTDGTGTNEANMFGPNAWTQRLRRYVTVNGQKIPTITIAPGEVRRLRLIDSGQRQDMRLQIERAPGTTGTGPNEFDFYEIAVDGLPTGGIRRMSSVELFPGYRSDVLIQPPANVSGEYYLVDVNARAGAGDTSSSAELLRWVAKIIVTGAPMSMSLPQPSALAPHRLPDIAATAATGMQHAYYGLAFPPAGGIRFFISRKNLLPGEVPTEEEFNLSNPRKLVLENTEQWRVGTRNGNGVNQFHPFHIHTNPFLITRVLNAGNVDVTAAEIGGPIWRDTIAMKQGYTYELLTRYDDFTGEFVDHCHILDHEDQGMMELVRIESAAPVPSPVASGDIRSNDVGSSIAAENGPSLLLFVQGSLCPHCMAQLTDMAREFSGERVPVTVVSGSTEDDLKNFPNVPFRLEADPEYKLFKEHGAYDGAPKHATIVRGPSGNILLRRVGDEPFTDLKVVQAALVAAATPRVVIAVRGTDDVSDDYLTWSPARCSLRLEAGQPGDPDLAVTLTNDAPGNIPEGGDVRFADTLQGGQSGGAETLSVELKQDGTPTEIYIAGSKPSSLTTTSLADGGRDAVIEVHQGAENGPVIGDAKVMVRVRKDASKLNSLERAELLDAVAAVKGNGMHERLLDLHTIATGRLPMSNWPDQAHRFAGFLPWHRAFLLQYERELQKIHPHVSLHYWREDVLPSVFQANFYGANSIGSSSSQLVDVDFGSAGAGNPLLGWQINGASLRRRALDRNDVSWCDSETTVLGPEEYRSPTSSFSRGLEGNPHNDGHTWVGGWMASCLTSPRDPIFFVFHCDIDRLWAKWQWTHGRFGFDGADSKDYLPNDKYLTGSSVPMGHHLKDSMWPWDQIQGSGTATDPNDNRPNSAPESPFPASSIPGVWPAAAAKPEAATMIDYLGSAGSGVDLGFCYDDVPLGEKSPPGPILVADASARAVERLSDDQQSWTEREKSAREIGSVTADQQRRLLEVVEDPTEADSIRIVSLRAATQGPVPEWIESAAKVLTAPQGSGPELREEIVNQIGILAMFTEEGHHSAPTIREALKSVLNEQESLPVRIAAFSALATEGDSEALELLENSLRSREVGLIPREQSVMILATAQPGEHLDVLRGLLSAEESNATRAAALLSLGNDAASLADRRTILLDPNEPPQVREAAFRSLMHGDPAFQDHALQLLRDRTESTSVRTTAAAGLATYVTYHVQSLTRDQLQRLQSELAALQVEDRSLQEAVRRSAEKIARWARTKQ